MTSIPSVDEPKPFDPLESLPQFLPTLEQLAWAPYETHQAMRAKGFDVFPLKNDGRLVEVIEAEFAQRYIAALAAQIAQEDDPVALRQALPVILSVLQQLTQAKPAARRLLQEHGVNVLPVNFYSNTPSLAEIESSLNINRRRLRPISCPAFSITCSCGNT